MSFIKIGEMIEISASDIQSLDSVSPMIDPVILENFTKLASNLKKIAPKAEDFLYFSCVMMHAAEAAAINPDGTPKLTRKGEPVQVGWEVSKNGSWKWVTNDPSIKPLKNSNGDVFPEVELIKAHKKWVGKPLCIDHKSSSVDHVRGIIVDTYYDRNLKRIVGLCALDKQNYPTLAKKVSTGVSNSVSMGTAVGKAICFDCGQVAKTEADFCKCMRNKSCYGEINVDLNPIELSIVVNGADPQARIKHVIAMANSLNSYVEEKQSQLNKLAKQTYSVSISSTNIENDESERQSFNFNFSSNDLESFKLDVQKALDDLSKLEDEIDQDDDNFKDTNSLTSNQTDSSLAMEETEEENKSLAPPADRFAEDLNTKFTLLKSSIEHKLLQMQQDLDKLGKIKEEETMAGSKLNKNAYFQGTEEPTPGSPQYAKDPMNEKLREDGDKHMFDQTTGPVDQLFPGDLEAKKLLARATAEERALRRQALASKAKEELLKKKEAYFQGTEEPTPGKPQYAKDPMNEDLREDGDKHMVGQKPFPDVGKVDGLHPSPDSVDQKDELKRKEMLSRATETLTARFHKSAQNLGNSSWQVSLGDKVIFAASVEEISGGRTDALYSTIATKAFAEDLLGKIKAHGADKVKAFYKKAQEVAPAPVATPPANNVPATDASVDAPVDAAPATVEDSGKEGDTKETAVELAEKVKDMSSDLNEAVKALTGEQSEMGELDGLAAEDGKVSTAALNSMRKELNSALLEACKESIATLEDHAGELGQITSLYDQGLVTKDSKNFVESVAKDSFASAKETIAESMKLLGAFVKYARGTQALIKRAQEEAARVKHAHGDITMEMEPKHDSLMAMLKEDGEQLVDEDFEADSSEDEDSLYNLLADDLDEDEDNNDAVMVPDAATAAQVSKENPSADVEVKKASADLTTKQGRMEARAKLAAEVKFGPMMDQAHPKGGTNPGGLDNKPTKDLALVETMEEVHDAMMANVMAPVKVRKEAEAIQSLVAEGKITASDFPALIANGLDSEAVAYWKKYFGEVEGGSEFASELVKEHAKAQAEEEKANYRVKIARAYEVAYEMVDRGLIPHERTAISAQVDEVMKWEDASFESFKRVIAKHPMINVKTAGRMPQVGMNDYSEVSQTQPVDFTAQLAAAFSKSSKRLF